MTWKWPWPQAAPPAVALPDGPEDPALRAALARVCDPELGLDIVSLGIVRHARRSGTGAVVVLAPTSPACPVGPWMVDEARRVLADRFPELDEIDVSLTWEPPWSVDEMSEAARASLGV